MAPGPAPTAPPPVAQRQAEPDDVLIMTDDEYSGLLASTWDIWRDDTASWRDRSFYLDMIGQYGEPVLDIGCGTGRLLLDYLAAGIDVDGVDSSAEMLDICRAKAGQGPHAPRLHQQRMEHLDVPRRYRTILGASSVLQLLTEASAAASALRRILRHLQPGGAFVTPFAFDWRPGDPLDTGWQLLFEKRRPADAATVRAWTREWREPAGQLWHTERRFEVEINGAVVETELHRRSPGGRWYTQTQASELFLSTGYHNIRVLRGFTHEPAREDDRLYCVLGERPARR
jgi:ubiquinone/menaquinone biosynthesis C-methylase UbiE